MPMDLMIAIIATGALSLLAFRLGLRLAETTSGQRPFLFAEAIVLCLTFAWLYSGRLAWARVIPHSAALYWSNWMPVLLLFTAGLATRTPGIRRACRPVAVGLLVLLASAYVLVPMIRPIVAPAMLTQVEGWKDDVCLQSHPSTCGAAAAATLLRLHGRSIDERTMVRDCLTSRFGSVPLGLYRGLAWQAFLSGKRARVADTDARRWFHLGQVPNVALIRYEDPRGFDEDTLDRFLGPNRLPRRGEGHAIVVLGMTDGGRWIIGDPAVGRVTWSAEEFEQRFTGDAIFLD